MLHLLSDFPTWWTAVAHLQEGVQSMQLHDHAMLLAQQFKQTDFVGDVSNSWNHFVRTGQVWAMLIGIVLGYMVKTFTSFG
jgi:hypothetical protein